MNILEFLKKIDIWGSLAGWLEINIDNALLLVAHASWLYSCESLCEYGLWEIRY